MSSSSSADNIHRTRQSYRKRQHLEQRRSTTNTNTTNDTILPTTISKNDNVKQQQQPFSKYHLPINNTTFPKFFTAIQSLLRQYTKHTKHTLFYQTLGNGSPYLTGLTLASIASTMLSTTFDMFYITIFLSIYHLPLKHYAWGSATYVVVGTVMNVCGACIVDFIAASSADDDDKEEEVVGYHDKIYKCVGKSKLTGMSGCLYAISFVAPFIIQSPSPERSPEETK
eukprot:15352667-Ditylum_brightwellii.AAC.1